MMKKFEHCDLEQLDKSDRINLINSLPGLKSANLIGTKSCEGIENLAIFSTVIHMGSNPPLIGFIHRPIGQFSHTLKNIEATGCYTINNIHHDIITQAHKTSEKFDHKTSEFEVCQFTPEYIDHFRAPFVSECKVKFGLSLNEIIPIQRNGTFLVLGEVELILIEENLLLEDFSIDYRKAKTVGVMGVDHYVEIGNKIMMN